MLFLSGADLVLPSGLMEGGTVVVDGDRIVDLLAGPRGGSPGDVHVDARNHFVVPGFIDLHIHGVEGLDSLDGGDVIGRIAARLPQYGVTAFCPTSVACAPAALRAMLADVSAARAVRRPGAARVLPAHLESNFINPQFRGAQPLDCLRVPGRISDGEFTGDEILAELAAARPDVGIVTLAPEIEGALDLIRTLTAAGHRVSLGHSGATYEQAVAGIDAGARHATHLFNRMTPFRHRAPGLTGAVLEREEVAAEVICDGFHVHPAAIRIAVAAKSPAGVVAITDGTAGSGLPRGSHASLGGRTITVGNTALLEDGTIAGSVLTMDRAFGVLVTAVGLSIVDAATVCSTTPARALRLHGFGRISQGATADLVMLDRNLRVESTYIAGDLAYRRPS